VTEITVDEHQRRIPLIVAIQKPDFPSTSSSARTTEKIGQFVWSNCAVARGGLQGHSSSLLLIPGGVEVLLPPVPVKRCQARRRKLPTQEGMGEVQSLDADGGGWRVGGLGEEDAECRRR